MAVWTPWAECFRIIQHCHHVTVTLLGIHIINSHHRLILNVGIRMAMSVVRSMDICATFDLYIE